MLLGPQHPLSQCPAGSRFPVLFSGHPVSSRLVHNLICSANLAVMTLMLIHNRSHDGCELLISPKHLNPNNSCLEQSLHPTHQPSPKESNVCTVLQIGCTLSIRQYLQYTATSYSSLQVFYLRTRFVHIKRSDDNHLWWRCEVPADVHARWVCVSYDAYSGDDTVVHAHTGVCSCTRHSLSTRFKV